MEEVWKQVDDILGGRHYVSSLGRVKTIGYYEENSIRFRKGVIIKQHDSNGYCRVLLRANKIGKSFRVHRLVARAFIPNPENYPQVNHINGIKTDNRVENLEWCNNSQNQIHALSTGLRGIYFGEEANRFKRKVGVYNANWELIDTLVGNADMKNKGYNYKNVSAVVTGRRTKYLGLYFKSLNS